MVECDWFEYPTSIFRFFRSGISIIELTEGLSTFLRNKYSTNRGVIFLCHSLGGLVAKQYIINCAMEERLAEIKGLLLFATPNNGAGLAGVSNYVPLLSRQVRQLCKNSAFLDNQNDYWARLKLNQKIPVKYVYGSFDRVVEKTSAQAQWGNDLAVINDKGHLDLVKPESDQDLVYCVTKKFLLASQIASNRLEKYDPKDVQAYLNILHNWEQYAMTSNWNSWSSWVFGGEAAIHIEAFDSLVVLLNWYPTVIWPDNNSEIRSSVDNFIRVVTDFVNVFSRHSTISSALYRTDKFYYIQGWDSEKYDRLRDQYQDHCMLVYNLLLEATRAGNWIIENVHTKLDPKYHSDVGWLSVDSPAKVPKYSEMDVSAGLYTDLIGFNQVVKNRDYFY